MLFSKEHNGYRGVMPCAKHPKGPENRTGKALSLSLNVRRCAVSLRQALSACLRLTRTRYSFTPGDSHQHQRGKQFYC